MIKDIYRSLNKQKYIKEIKYKKDKSIQTRYIHQSKYKPDYLVNNDHIFLSGGYRTVLTSDSKKETINPLDLSSAYPVESFQTAIESKAIKDVFSTLSPSGLDLERILLFVNTGGIAILVYYLLFGGVA